MFNSLSPDAADFIKTGSYVDDLLSSCRSASEAETLTSSTEQILAKGNFTVKFWIYSGCDVQEGEGKVKVLGVCWKPLDDRLVFGLSVNFSPMRHGVHVLPDLKQDQVPSQIPQILTKRLVLSQVMSIYDPMGMLSPFTLYGKVLLRASWEVGVGWDEALPEELHRRWVDYFVNLYKANELSYPRSMKPEDAIGDPMLILFSDASDLACGFCAYVRWSCAGNVFKSRLVLS